MLVSEISSKCGQKCEIVAIEKNSQSALLQTNLKYITQANHTYNFVTTPTFEVRVATHTLILTSNFSLRISVYLTT